MKEETVQNSRPKTKRGSWLMEQLLEQSFTTENIYIKNAFFIAFCKVAETLLFYLLPLLAMLPNQNSSVDKLIKYSEIISVGLVRKISEIPETVLILQLAILLLSTGVFAAMFSKNQSKVKIYALKLLAIYYPLTLLIFMLQGQTVLSLFNKTYLEETDYCIIVFLICNYIVVGYLCGLYTLLFSTYCSTSYNHLCTKFNKNLITISWLSRIFSISTPYLIQMNKDRTVGDENNITIPLVYWFVLLGFFGIKLKLDLNSITFFNTFAQKVHEVCQCFELSFMVIYLLVLSIEERLLKSNFYFITFSFFGFVFFTLQAYRNHKLYKCHLKTWPELETENDAEMYILELSQILTKMENETHSLLLSNIVSHHEIHSDNVHFNYEIEINASKQAKDKYYGGIIFRIMDEIVLKFENSQKLLTLVSYLKFTLNKQYVATLESMRKRAKESSFFDNFFLYKFVFVVEEYLNNQNLVLDIGKVENCMQSEYYLVTVMLKFVKLIKLKQNFWNYFSKGIVSIQTFEKNMDEQLSLLKEFQYIFTEIINKFDNSYILVSFLIAYERYILMKDKLSEKVTEKATILRKRDRGTAILKNEKSERSSVEKSIFSPKSCVIEITVDSAKLGTVISSSKNVENVLGYEPEAIKGININKIMPESMQEEHDYLLNNWKQNCSWEKIGKYRGIFGVDKSHISFSTIIYFKPIVRLETVNVMAAIFKDNDQDYMIIDNNGEIVGAGEKYFAILGPMIVGLPFSLVCSQAQNIQKWARVDQRIKYKSVFYPTRNCENMLGELLKKKYDLNDQGNDNKNLIQQIRSFQTTSTIEDLMIEFEVYPYRIGRILFSVLKMENVSSDFHKAKSLNVSFTTDVMHRTTELDSKESVTTAADSSKNFLAYNSSAGSSAISSLISSENNVTFFESMFLGKIKIHDFKIIRVIIIVIIGCVVSIGLISVKIIINSEGVKELLQIQNAEKESVESLELAILVFNQGVTISELVQSSPINIEGLKSHINMTDLEIKMLHSSIKLHIEKVTLMKSSLTNSKLYSFYLETVQWKSESQIMNIHMTDFLLNYLYLMKGILEEADALIKGNTVNLTKVNYFLKTISDNFETLNQRIFYNFALFEAMAQNTSDHITMLTYIKMSFSIFCFCGIMLCFRKYYELRLNQENNIYNQFKQLPYEVATNLSDYFNNLSRIFTKTKRDHQKSLDIDTVENIFKEMQIIYEESPVNDSNTYSSLKTKLNIRKKSYTFWTFFYVFWVIFSIGINIGMLLIERELIEESQIIMQHHHTFVRSENELINTYFTVKSQSHLNNIIDKELVKKLIMIVKTTSVSFIENMIESLKILRKDDPFFPNRMSTLLIKDLCDRNTIDKEIITMCEQMNPEQILEGGILNFMVYLQRNLGDSFHQYLSLPDGAHWKDLEYNHKFEIMDDSLFFAFELFRDIQNQLIISLDIAIDKNHIRYTILNSVELFVFALLMCFTFFFYSIEKEKSINRIGRILLLPIKYLKNNKKMVKIFEHIIDFDSIK